MVSWIYPGLRVQQFSSLLLQDEKRQEGTTQLGTVKLLGFFFQAEVDKWYFSRQGVGKTREAEVTFFF